MMKAAIRTATLLLAFAAAASAQTPAGGEFRVNTNPTSGYAVPRSAMEPDGDFVVVWGSGPGVIGRRFAASGAPRGSEFQINAYTTAPQGVPAVAVGSRGDSVVVWVALGHGIPGRRFDASGSAIGSEFLVNTFTMGYQTWPNVGRASDGRFVVSWTSDFVDGSSSGIAARRFDASGNPIGSEFVVNTYTTGYQEFGHLAVEANGNFVVVWEDHNNRDGSGSAIFGQRYDASGNRLGSEFQVNSYTTGNQRIPSVSVSPAGGFVVAWSSEFGDGSAYGMFARRFDASGNAVGDDFVVNAYTTGGQGAALGAVAHDARGNFVVTWVGQGGTGSGSLAQRFNASGARRGVEFRANTNTTFGVFSSSVASDSVGNFVVVWEQRNYFAGLGAFAQRFGGLGAAALTVDSPGNQVLEPGETVDVRPTWRNFNGAPQSFSGTLTGITGPAGPTYTITDPAGNYGTVANDATGQCADCYAVSVSNPAMRPAMHWDASAVESIVPDTQGQQKQWLLHVGVSFTDVATASPFYRFIETLLHHGVTSGCSPTQYCPANATTREQMAVLVLVAKEGTVYVPTACTTPMFSDVPASNPFCRWIEELARRGVVAGCGGGNYCPGDPVTREQMAVFVLRTLDPTLNPPACGPPAFTDVPASSPFCRWIEELVRRGVVTGCGGSNYCPATAVTREQMSVFISGTFGLALYGP
jgi:S-layer family protein